MKLVRYVVVAVLLVAVLVGVPALNRSLQAQDISHFKGKTITFLVPFKPGGGFDFYARLLTPYFEKYLPGSKVIVKNEPAGGGLAAMNMLARSKPDGTTIMIVQVTGAVLNELAEVRGLRYESAKFTWLGRLVASPYVMVSSSKSPFKTVDDMKAAKREMVIAGVGRDFSSMAARAMCDVFDIPYRTVMGYGGSGEMILAIIRGDADISAFSYDGVRPSIQAGELHGIVMMMLKKMDVPIPQASKEAERLNVPKKKRDMLQSITNLLDIYRAIAASPGLSPELARVMRTTYEKAVNDPDFVASAKKSSRPGHPLSGEETQKLVAEAIEGLKQDESALKMIKEMFGGA